MCTASEALTEARWTQYRGGHRRSEPALQPVPRAITERDCRARPKASRVKFRQAQEAKTETRSPRAVGEAQEAIADRDRAAESPDEGGGRRHGGCADRGGRARPHALGGGVGGPGSGRRAQQVLRNRPRSQRRPGSRRDEAGRWRNEPQPVRQVGHLRPSKPRG